MRKQRVHWMPSVSHLLYGIIVGSLYIGNIKTAQAANKINYTKPPFAAFASQMTDGLNGGGKYEKARLELA